MLGTLPMRLRNQTLRTYRTLSVKRVLAARTTIPLWNMYPEDNQPGSQPAVRIFILKDLRLLDWGCVGPRLEIFFEVFTTGMNGALLFIKWLFVDWTLWIIQTNLFRDRRLVGHVVQKRMYLAYQKLEPNIPAASGAWSFDRVVGAGGSKLLAEFEKCVDDCHTGQNRTSVGPQIHITVREVVLYQTLTQVHVRGGRNLT